MALSRLGRPLCADQTSERVEQQRRILGRWPRRLTGCAFAIGATGLLLAMATDAIAVLGRHLGLPLLGAIELVQTCVVLASAASIVIATLHGSHARVHILTERLPTHWQGYLNRAADLSAACVFVAIAAGSCWILLELWSGHETTELLRIPLRWLRLYWLLAALLVAALFVIRLCSRQRGVE